MVDITIWIFQKFVCLFLLMNQYIGVKDGISRYKTTNWRKFANMTKPAQSLTALSGFVVGVTRLELATS